ncbi:MAG: C40 family peptidase [Desulfobaccales bacterium]
MARKIRGAVAILLGSAVFLAGCAGAPPPAAGPPPSQAPLPQAHRSPQEIALERALGEFYGAPYRAGGTTPQGVDCSGLVQALLQRAGVNLPRTVAQQYDSGRPVGPGQLRFGDVVFFDRYCQQGRDFYLASIVPSFTAQQVCHDGLYLGEGRFLHASPQGVCVSRLDAEVWRASYRGARRYLAWP